MTNPAATERALLCDLLDDLGPDAPTLCGDWTTRDLAAHLVVRDRRPDAGPGIVTPLLAGYSEKVRVTETERPYSQIVERVRSGPPRWSPMRIDHVNTVVNTVEFFVHHEDVRRARPGWTSRSLDATLERTLVRLVSGPMFKLLARRSPVGISIEPNGHPGTRLKDDDPTVAIVGPVGEIVLFLFGRQTVAEVALEGPGATVDLLRTVELGI
ncbi:MAG: TIGR03085 family metal-binding protein [Desertimonas sp.]